MSRDCELSCYDCGALCLCSCHKEKVYVVAIGAYDRIFDLVDRKQKIFYVDLKELKLHNDVMDKLLRFLYSKGYALCADAFIWGERI